MTDIHLTIRAAVFTVSPLSKSLALNASNEFEVRSGGHLNVYSVYLSLLTIAETLIFLHEGRHRLQGHCASQNASSDHLRVTETGNVN